MCGIYAVGSLPDLQARKRGLPSPRPDLTLSLAVHVAFSRNNDSFGPASKKTPDRGVVGM